MQIKNAFLQELNHLKVDKTLLKKISLMETGFVNKNSDHIEFFGGGLTGVQVVRFTQEDRDILFTEVLKTDEINLRDTLYSLKDKNGLPVINQEFKVSSDIFNISCIYLLHEIENSRYLTEKERDEAKIEVCLYLLYRFLTSRLFRHFIYPADKATAQATYESLSNKYLLKQTGSWSACLRTMATNFVVRKDSIHYKTIKDMDNDTSIIYMINDIQGRIRDMLKNIYNEFDIIHKKGVKFSNNTAFVELDGEIILKDKRNSLDNYTRYIKSIVSDKGSFIKDELIDIVTNVMHTMPEKLLRESLEWTSNNYGHKNDLVIEETIDAVMHHAFYYLFNHQSLVKNEDLSTMILRLRGTYMSSRSNEDTIVEARTLARRIITLSTKTKNDSVIAATRTGWMIYIVIRALTKNYYTN